MLIIGNSILEGIGTAMLIPPVYILPTLLFTDLTSRARAFGVISAMGGIGAAAGPLIGGLITSAISWRAAFIFQALVIAVIVLLSRRIKDPLPPDATWPFDITGPVLSALGLVHVVVGILAADNNLWLMLILIVAGALVLALFFRSIRAKERAGNGFCRVDIHRVLVQSNLLRVIEPETTHRPHNPHIPVENRVPPVSQGEARRAGGRPTAIPGMAAAIEDAQAERLWLVRPTAAKRRR